MNRDAENRLAQPATPQETTMLTALFARRSPRRFVWRPAVDLTNPRIAAVLTTFTGN
jgi:hypothetical protein